MIKLLLIAQFCLAIVITILVLLQKSSSIGLGAYSGSNESMFGAKGPANFLTRFTFIIGFLFVINTVTLGYFYNKEKNSSLIDKVETIVPETQKPAPIAPITTKELPNIPIKSEVTPTTKALPNINVTIPNSTTTASPKVENISVETQTAKAIATPTVEVSTTPEVTTQASTTPTVEVSTAPEVTTQTNTTNN